MRVTCPTCVQTLEIPDTDAGQSVSCPSCGGAFMAPVLFDTATPPVAVISPPPPPPNPYLSTLPDLTEPVEPEPEEPPLPFAEEDPDPITLSSAPEPIERSNDASVPVTPKRQRERERTLFLSRRVIPWVAPACFSLIFLLSFVSWIGVYPAGEPVYTQNAWQAVFARFSVGPVGGTKFEPIEENLQQAISSNWLMLPSYLMMLLLGNVIAWVGPILPRVLRPIPPKLVPILAYRNLALCAVAGLCLLVLLGQMSLGFGLENAVERVVAEQVGPDTSKTYQQRHEYQVRFDSELGAFRLERTTAFYLVLLAHFVALMAIGVETWLARRRDREPPSITIRW